MTQRPAVPSPASLNMSSPKSESSSPSTALILQSVMSVAIVKSSRSPSTSPKAARSGFHAPPSAAYSDEQHASVPVGTLFLCPCGAKFEKQFPEQQRCHQCRQTQLRAEEKRNDAEEIECFNQFRDSWDKHHGDWLLHDPDHPEVLIRASVLAKRYRGETTPRGIRNSLSRWY